MPAVNVSPRPKGLDGYFKIKERGSTVLTELRGGATTFLAMSYIVVLNPLILGFKADSQGNYLGGGSGDGSNLPIIAAGTALVAFIMCVAMGTVARSPIAIATGLGLNAFVASAIAPYTTWSGAMGLVLIEGVVSIILVLTRFREAIFRAFPDYLKTCIAAGIGAFLIYIALVDAGFARRIPDVAGTTVPVQLGQTGQLAGVPVAVFAFGVILTVVLWARHTKGAILIAIVVTTVVATVAESIGNFGSSVNSPTGWMLNIPSLPSDVIDLPSLDSFGTFGTVSFDAFRDLGFTQAIVLVFVLLMTDVFDSVGTVTAISEQADLVDGDGLPADLNKVLLVDSSAAAVGGLFGVSSNTSYIESAAGVGDGARTGLASVVTGLLFALTIPLAPLVKVVPSEAAAPALVVVGFIMMGQLFDLRSMTREKVAPAIATVLFMPFTYSIAVDVGAGVLLHTATGLATKKKVGGMMIGLTVLFAAFFAIRFIVYLLP